MNVLWWCSLSCIRRIPGCYTQQLVCVCTCCRASIWGAAVCRLCVSLIFGFAKDGFPLSTRKTICSATGPSRCSWQQTQHNITAPALLRVAHYTHIFLSITCFAADQGSRLCSKPASRVSLVMIHLGGEMRRQHVHSG
jgi:hypothetical protein